MLPSAIGHLPRVWLRRAVSLRGYPALFLLGLASALSDSSAEPAVALKPVVITNYVIVTNVVLVTNYVFITNMVTGTRAQWPMANETPGGTVPSPLAPRPFPI